MSEALTVREQNQLQLGTLNASTPEQLLSGAAAIATPLAEMIERQGLSNQVQGRKYVRAEGWTTMGAMLGVVPREVSNVCGDNGIFTATIELVNIKTGAIVGRASAECGAPDEVDRNGQPVWANRPRYARRSMAATRATSKAFRLSFSWIMTMSGYEATPAEEIPDGGFGQVSIPVPANRQPAPQVEDDFILNFGKYRGKSIKTVDNGYLHWLMEQTEKDLNDTSKAKFKNSNEARMSTLLREKQRRAQNSIEAEIIEDPLEDAPF